MMVFEDSVVSRTLIWSYKQQGWVPSGLSSGSTCDWSINIQQVFSCRRIEAPSVIILNATVSSSLPSFMRCAFKISTRGFPSLSNTSFAVSRWLGGMAQLKEKKSKDHINWNSTTEDAIITAKYLSLSLTTYWSIFKVHIKIWSRTIKN